jgi:hypothetical protein
MGRAFSKLSRLKKPSSTGSVAGSTFKKERPISRRVVLGAIALQVFPPRSAINRENFEKLHGGQPARAVEAILGGPRGEAIGLKEGCARARSRIFFLARQATIATVRRISWNPDRSSNPEGSERSGLAMRGRLSSTSTRADKVRHVHFAHAVYRNESFFEKLRRWLGL